MQPESPLLITPGALLILTLPAGTFWVVVVTDTAFISIQAAESAALASSRQGASSAGISSHVAYHLQKQPLQILSPASRM